MAGGSIEIDDLLGTPSYLATEISNNWSTWKQAKSGFEKVVKSNIEYLYACSTRETENGSEWDHSTNVPKLAHIYDTLKANYMDGLMPSSSWLSIESEGKLKRDKKNKILSFLKTKHRLRNLKGKVDKLLDNWIQEGNCIAAVSYVRETHINPLTNAEEVGYQGPEVTVIPPSDIVFNLAAKSFEQSPKIIRTVMTLGEVARELDENPGVRYDAAVLREVLERRGRLADYSTDDLNKSSQISLDGFGGIGDYYKGDQVEFLHFYGDIYNVKVPAFHKNHVITVVDRSLIARNEPLNTWSGRPHIFHSAWRSRPNNLWGQGPLDTLVGMQYRINHLENARADAFDEMLYGDLIFIGDVEVRKGEDGNNIYYAADGGNVKRLAPDATVLNADFQIAEYERKMELFAGSPKEAAGFRTPGEKTKFEVARLENASARLFQNKMTKFEIDILEKIVNAELEVTKFNLDGRDAIRIDDEETGMQDFVDIKKDDLLFNGKVIPIGARHFARQAQLASDLAGFQMNALQDPAIAQHFPTKRIAKAWERVMGADEFELYEEYGRIPEQLEAQRRTEAAQQLLAEERDGVISDLEGDGVDGNQQAQ